MRTRTTILVTAGLVAATATYFYAKVIFSEVGIMQLHPEIPQRDIIRAHRRMFLDIATGKVKVDGFDDDQFDEMFLSYVAKLDPQ